jgi:ABC-type phosphate/phosphonate transport system substrate-binding protein
MKKFRCYSQKPEDYPGFVIEGDFPDKIMVCLPLEDLKNLKIKNLFLLIPEKEEEDRYAKSLRLVKEFLAETSPEDLAKLIEEAKKTANGE